MPLSESQIRRQVAKDFRDKLSLEKKLKGKLRLLANGIVNKFRSDMLIGTITNASFFNKKLQGILKLHYQTVSREFSGRTLDRLFDFKENTLTELEKGKLEEAINSYINRRSIEQAIIILNTTQKNMVSASAAVISETASQIERSVNASTLLSRKLISREARIASLETQAMSEARKIAEADIFSKKEPLTLQIPTEKLLKEWVTVGDERVRPAHVNADSQLQFKEDFFIVKGEQLRFPGDTSFGATPGNVINCRCSAVYSTE